MPDVEKPDADQQTVERRRATGEKAKQAASTMRSKTASLVWLVAVVCALFLSVGALLVALKANQDNAAVKFVLDGADTLDLGIFSRDEGIFTFERDRDEVRPRWSTGGSPRSSSSSWARRWTG